VGFFSIRCQVIDDTLERVTPSFCILYGSFALRFHDLQLYQYALYFHFRVSVLYYTYTHLNNFRLSCEPNCDKQSGEFTKKKSGLGRAWRVNDHSTAVQPLPATAALAISLLSRHSVRSSIRLVNYRNDFHCSGLRRMLATPLLPAPTFSSQHDPDDSMRYRPSRDIETFNSLLPPPIEFLEGSSSGALAVPEGKYEPINSAGSQPPSKTDVRFHSRI
jgi:hypothetical protein